MRLILGSQSPRRKEILNFFSIPFVQIPSTFDEKSVLFKGDPEKYALELSQEKAQEITNRFPNDLILTADTIVFFEGTIYNKPKDEEEAFRMKRALSGKWHTVFTALTVQKNNVTYSKCEETKILFNHLTDEQIQLYNKHCAILDKAGGYAIQGSGSILIARMEGCYYNVMGLPVNTLSQLLEKFNIDLWKHLKECL